MKYSNLVFTIGIFLLTACAGSSVRIPQAIATPTPPAEPQIEIFAEGLLSPIGLAILPDGGLLVAEAGSGEKDNSAGVSLITPEGEAGRLISGLPSSRDAGDLAGVNTVAVAPDGDRIYVGNFGQGHLWQLSLDSGDLTLPEIALGPDQLTPAMERLNNVFLTNPFDITFDPQGVPVVSDASGNGVARENPDGTVRFIHRFAPLPDPSAASERVTIEAVPTGIVRVGGEYYVTLTGGCPYPAGGGQLVAIDEERNQRIVAAGLNMPIDVARGPDGTIWLLEFARFDPAGSCFSGQDYLPNTGRLSRLQPGRSLLTVIDDLNYPGAVLPGPDGSLYLSEVFSGRVIRVSFE